MSGREEAARPVVLFVCVHNAGRSLAAKVLLEHYAQGRVAVRSAGSEPANELNPAVIRVLRARGLDPTGEFPRLLDDEMADGTDVVVTMGCGDACPTAPGRRHLDWDLDDPAGRPDGEVRAIVDEIDQLVQGLLAELVGAG